MNRNEESSLPGITSMPSISRHVIEDLVANDNAPQMIDNTTPIRSSLRARSVGRRFAAALLPRLFGTNPRSQHKGATGRVNGFQFYAIANLDKT